jgi:hypothetical protein
MKMPKTKRQEEDSPQNTQIFLLVNELCGKKTTIAKFTENNKVMQISVHKKHKQ